MKVPVSISMEVARAQELGKASKDAGMTLSAYVNQLIESGMTLSEGLDSDLPPLDSQESDKSLDDVSGSSWPPHASLERMSFREKVQSCLSPVPRPTTEISAYLGLSRDGVQIQLDELLEQGAVFGRRSAGGEWVYWLPARP